MSAPYQVLIDHYGDHQSFPCATLDVAIKVAQVAHEKHPGRVHVLGDGAEGGYGDDGTEFWDGLTEDERERVAIEAFGQ